MKLIYLRFLGVCLFVNQIDCQDSYRSSVNEDGRPILRAGNVPEGSIIAGTKYEPSWLRALRRRIEQLVAKHGYDDAKPYINKTVQDAEKEHTVLLDVKGESDIEYKYISFTRLLRAGPDRPEDDRDPVWVGDLKGYVRKLVARYDVPKIDPHLRPVIDDLQERHSVAIKDIDGNVMIDYSQQNQKKAKVAPDSKIGKQKERYSVTQIIE